MTCHITMNLGFTERMETVTSLEINPDIEGIIINGVKDQIPNARKDLPVFPLDSIGVFYGTKMEFLCKDGKAYSYRIRKRSDLYRIVNEVNFLLDLEKV